MTRRRLSAIALSVLLVVSATVGAVPAAAFAPSEDLSAVGNTSEDTSGNDSNTSLTKVSDTTDSTATSDDSSGPTDANEGPENSTDPTGEKSNPKVSSSLLGEIGSSETDARNTGTEFVQVVLRASPGRSDRVAGLVGTNGGDVEARHDNLVQARVPEAAVESLSSSPAVEFVRQPREPDTSEITSEGLSNMDVGTVHDSNYTGDNVTVAVVDSGFNVSNPEIADQLVDWRNFSSADRTRMSNETGEHGTATAELVADTAPNASIIAVKVGSEVELYEAIDWLESNTSTDVVTMSLSYYNVGPFDGTAKMNREIGASVENGTTWLTSAGNDADADHWNGTWSNPDGNRWMNFSGSDELMNVTPSGGSGTLSIAISWNDWGGSSEDYDFYLYDANGNVVESSTDVQSGSQSPTEYIYEYVNEPVYLGIYNADANGTADFDLFFRGNADPEYWTETRSVTVPGTGENILTVGAAHYYDDELEGFSSRGPTIDGRIKPDVVAPDGVTTSGYDSFYGTSASTPHTAGVVALMLDANESLSPTTVKDRLQSSAAPLHGDEPNNRTGYGLVDADGAIPEVEETTSDTVNYSGRVFESDGEYAVNHEVNAYQFDSSRSVSGYTNATGHYSISALTVEDNYVLGYYQGDFSESGSSSFMPRDGSPDLRAIGIVNGTNSSDLGSVELPQANLLNVTVVDESGDPVSDATVKVMHFTESNGNKAYTSYRSDVRSDGMLTTGETVGIEVVGQVRIMASPPDDSARFDGPTYTAILDVQSDRDVTVTLQSKAGVSGQVHEADGTPSSDDLMYIHNESIDDRKYVYTDETGNFSNYELAENKTYDIGYYQNYSSGLTPFPRDGSPDAYLLDRVNATTTVDLGNRDLPNASVLNVRAENESGDPVENATVNVTHHRLGGDTDLVEMTTDSGGYMKPYDYRGLELIGNISLEVEPPENSTTLVNQTYTRNLTVDNDTNVTVTLEEKDLTGPDISNFDLHSMSDDESLLVIRFYSDEPLETRKVNITDSDGNTVAQVDKNGLSEEYTGFNYKYETTVSVSNDGTYHATLVDASDTEGNSDFTGNTSDETTVDTTAPTITDFGLSNEGSDVDVSFNVSEPLVNLTVTFEGDAPADPYYLSDFDATENDAGGYTYTANVSDGVGVGWANATLTEAVDDHTLDGASNQTDHHEWDAVAPNVTNFSANNPGNRTIRASFDANETLADVAVEVSGPENATLTEANFSETGGTYTATHDVGSDGNYTVALETAADDSGNDGADGQRESVTVDTTEPDVSVQSLTDADDNKVVSEDETISAVMDISDALSGVKSATLESPLFDGGSVALNDSDDDGVYDGNFTADASSSSDGIYDVHVTATDTADNEYRTFMWQFNLDTHAPNTTSGLSGTEGDNGWYTSEVNVTFDASDGTSSVAETRYRVDEGSWTVGSYTVVSDGNHTVEFYGVDAAGNNESVASTELKVDAVAPTTNLSVNGTEGDNGWYTSEVNVTLNSSDDVSGVNAPSGVNVTEYRVDGGSWQTYDGPFALSDGNHTVEFYSTDVAGNQEVVRNETVKVDTSDPTVGTPALNDTTEILPEAPVEVVVNASDENGIADVVVGGVPIGPDGEGPVPAAAPLGNHTFEVTVYDPAGNQRVVETGEYSVGEQIEVEVENGSLEAETNDTNVGEVAIETNESETNASVEVGTATKNPEETDPEGTSLYFPQINTSVSNDNITDATVTVTVEKSRVFQKYVVPDTVGFWVEEEGKATGWEKVDATLVAESEDTYTYEIEAPHFSTYAITGETESTPPTVEEFGTESESPSSGDVTLSASFGDDYSGVDPANVTLEFNGTDVTSDASVTDSGLTYTANLTPGEYDAKLVVTDNADNARQETITVTVAEESDGGSGGSGGSSGGGGGVDLPSAPLVVELTDVTDDSLTAKVLGASADDPASISPAGGLRVGDVTLRSLEIAPAGEDNHPPFFLDAAVTAEAPGGATAPDAPALGYVQVASTDISESDVSRVGVTFAVPSSAVAAPENVVLYRHAGGEWERVETTVVGERDGQYVLKASASGLGTFAAGVQSADLSVTDAAVGASSVEPGETVQVTATVENAGAGTGTATAELAVDGQVVAEEQVEVAGGESAEVTFEVAFSAPGDHEVEVSGVSAGSVSVAGETTTDESAETTTDTTTETTTDDGGSGGIPGFGVGTALVALLAGLVVARKRE